MNLVKWLRKNNTKIMAVVVIVLMIGFVGGSSLTYLLRGSDVRNATVAYYGNNIKIKRYDMLAAQQEMDILKMLQTNNILQALSVKAVEAGLSQNKTMHWFLESFYSPSRGQYRRSSHICSELRQVINSG